MLRKLTANVCICDQYCIDQSPSALISHHHICWIYPMNSYFPPWMVKPTPLWDKPCDLIRSVGMDHSTATSLLAASTPRFRSIKSFHSSTATAKFFGASYPAYGSCWLPADSTPRIAHRNSRFLSLKVGPSGDVCCSSFTLLVAALILTLFLSTKTMLLPNVPKLPSLWRKPLVLVLPSRCACSQVAFCHKDWVKKIDVLWCRWPAAAWPQTCLGWGSQYWCIKALILPATTKQT